MPNNSKTPSPSMPAQAPLAAPLAAERRSGVKGGHQTQSYDKDKVRPSPLVKGGHPRQSLGLGDFRILGIDPGFGRTGLGIVDFSHGNMKHVWHSCIETPADSPFIERLQAIRNDVTEAIRRFTPNVTAVEKIFFQSNAKTAINVGMARGVMLLALADAGLPIIELTPNEVKQGVAGDGSADKKQIQFMVKSLLKLSDIPKPDDAADALAIAISGGYIHHTNIRLNHDS